MLNLSPGQRFYELGCGDGRVLMEAHSRGLEAIGYELNPLLYLIAKFKTRNYNDRISVKFGNFWSANLSDADGIYVFLLDKFMKKLDAKLEKELRSGVSLVSFNFKIPGKKPIKHLHGVYQYQY